MRGVEGGEREREREVEVENKYKKQLLKGMIANHVLSAFSRLVSISWACHTY